MLIHLLGTAAGGGVPQWNCNCRNCREARQEGGRVRPRTQSGVAISADGQHWFLLNASPDLGAQIERFPPLHPPRANTRGSPIEGVLLTNADLDHTLGLFLLREGKQLQIHATQAIRKSLTEGISLASTMAAFCALDWRVPPSKLSLLPNADGSASGLLYQSVPLPGKPPRFSVQKPSFTDHVVGYRFVDKKTGGRLLFLPDVSALNTRINRLLRQCDVLLMDGTFWSEDEMQQQGAGDQPASRMGHWPIAGPGGSLAMLKRLKVRRRVYIHINNTNPILREGSPERAAVAGAGCEIGEDGMEFRI